MSPWARAAPLSLSCCQHRLMPPCRAPLLSHTSCPAGAAASSCDSWGTAVACRAWGGTGRPTPCWGQGLVLLVGPQPPGTALGCKPAPTALVSANTGSEGARSKWGSGDTGSKHELWSVCCLGKGWKINLPSPAVLCTGSFFLTLHTSSWVGEEQHWLHGGDGKAFFWEVLAASRGSLGWEGGVW